MCVLSLGYNVIYYINHEVLFRPIILPMVDVPPVLRSPGYCRVLGRFWLVSGHSPVRQSQANRNCSLPEWTGAVVVRVFTGDWRWFETVVEFFTGDFCNGCQVRRPSLSPRVTGNSCLWLSPVWYYSLGASGFYEGGVLSKGAGAGAVVGTWPGAGAHLLGICYWGITDPALLSWCVSCDDVLI